MGWGTYTHICTRIHARTPSEGLAVTAFCYSTAFVGQPFLQGFKFPPVPGTLPPCLGGDMAVPPAGASPFHVDPLCKVPPLTQLPSAL